MCTKNHNQVRGTFPEIRSERQNFLSFCLFTLLLTWKIKILKKLKKHHFTHVYQKSQSYDVCFLRYGVQQTHFFCHFGPFFALLPTIEPEN